MVRMCRRKKLLGVAVSLTGIAISMSPALVSPALARRALATRTYKVDYTVAKGKVPTDLLHQTGRITGSPFGSATFTGRTVVPITTYVWSFKAGKLDIRFDGTLRGITASGPWRVTGGTGEFRHAHGSGTASGAINGTKQFHFVGKVSL